MITRFLCFTLFILCSNIVTGKTLIINDEPIEIGDITANGPGCPEGTVSAAVTPDNLQLAILFSSYKAITSDTNPIAISNCNIAIEIGVGIGLSVGVVNMDWRGSVNVAENAVVNFHREFFFSGSTGPNVDNNWTTTGFENFTITDNPMFTYYSPCDGSPLIARVDTAASVVGANSFFSIRSSDVNAQLLFTLDVVDCPAP